MGENSVDSSDREGFIRRRCIAAVLALATVFYAVFIARTSFVVDGERYFTLFDDAMISMRYGANLAGGHGLVWNPGEAPVEGYTNFLWTLWMAGVHFLPLAQSKFSLVIMLTGSLILIANALVIRRIAERLAPGSVLASIGAVTLVAFHYALIFWTLRGMEVGLLVLLTDLAILLYLQLVERFESRTLGLLAGVLALSLLVRMDALVCFLVIWFFVVLTAPARARLTCVAIALGSALAALGGQLAFRLAYYGEWLPNTYYLKMTAGGLGERVTRGLEVFETTFEKRLYPIAVILALSLAVIWRKDRRWLARPELFVLPAVFLAQVSYSIYVGGDAWEWMGYANRYVTVGVSALLVFTIVVLARAAQLLGPRPAVRRAAVALLLAIGLVMNLSPLSKWVRGNAIHAEDDATQVRMALNLRTSTEPDATLAVVCAGSVPYFVERSCIDLLGKNDPVIAKGTPVANEPLYPGHNFWNYEHSLGVLRPEVIVQLWKTTPKDLEYIRSLGYERQREGHYLLRPDGEQGEVEGFGAPGPH